MRRIAVLMAVAVLAVAGCSSATGESGASEAADAPATTAPVSSSSVAPADTAPPEPPAVATTLVPTTSTISPFARPAWLGTRLLPLRTDEHGEVQPTPEELVDRAFETIDVLPPPIDDQFVFTLGPVPDDVLARSTWREECPVAVDELSYLTVSHYGFDGAFHTGEMIVNASVGEEIVEILRQVHEARFPIEQMRVIRQEEVDAHPTGDWNDTTSFVCRPAVGSGRWSNHAYGLAIDINPFHNPYLKGDLVLPELASVYVDRDDVRTGMIVAGDAVTAAFADIGWGWGGNWNSLKDWMHFSWNGN